MILLHYTCRPNFYTHVVTTNQSIPKNHPMNICKIKGLAKIQTDKLEIIVYDCNRETIYEEQKIEQEQVDCSCIVTLMFYSRRNQLIQILTAEGILHHYLLPNLSHQDELFYIPATCPIDTLVPDKTLEILLIITFSSNFQ